MVWENLNESAMPLLEGILMMNDFTLLVSRSERLTHAREHLNEMFGKKYPKNFRKEHIEYHKDEPEELAVINYTSGTTSYSKGVMLPYRSLWSNTKFAYEVLELKAGDKIVSMLPMAHMYGLAFEFLYEFSDYQEERTPETGNADHENLTQSTHHQRQDKSNHTRRNDQSVRWKLQRNHRRWSSFQPGGGTIP